MCADPWLHSDPAGPLGVVRVATLVVRDKAEALPDGLAVTSRDPDPTTTAYPMLAVLARAPKS